MLQRPLNHCPEEQGNRGKGPWRSKHQGGAGGEQNHKILEESRFPTTTAGPQVSATPCQPEKLWKGRPHPIS